MEKQGIISKLDQNTATEWLNSFVIIKKPNGDLRICLDSTNPNKYIVRPVCNLNTLDEVSFKLKDTKFFSVFDATKGCFHTHIFNILTMGVSNLNDLLESALREFSQGLDDMVNIADDILVFGSTQAEQNQNVISFLERCLEVDLKLIANKVRLNCTEVLFSGKECLHKEFNQIQLK